MHEFYPQQLAAMRAAGLANVQEHGATGLAITFNAIGNSLTNRAKYAALLGGQLNTDHQITITLPNGTMHVNLTDKDESDDSGPLGTAYVHYGHDL